MSEQPVVNLAKPEQVQQSPQQNAQQPRSALAYVLGWLALGYAAYQVYATVSENRVRQPAAAVATSGIPGCDDPDTHRALRRMALNLMPESGVSPEQRVPRVGKVREFGYASAERQRGCIAELTIAGEAIAFAYEVGMTSGDFQHMAVMGGDATILQARFSQIGRDGRFRHQAEPIGRAALKKALRAGIDAVRPGYASTRMPDPLHPLFSTVNPDRQHEIVDVEPVGPCRQIADGGSYACPLMIQHADPLGAILGQPDTIFQAEFTFVRQPDGGWAMPDSFFPAFHMAAMKERTRVE